MLRDRLVCGIRDAKVQRRLLAEPDLKFKKALELAQAAEAAERDTEELQGNQASNMHVLANTKGKTYTKEINNNGKPCNSCGESHSPDNCRFRNAICHYCHKRGHIARVCRKKARQQQSLTTTGSNRQPQHTHQVREEPETNANTYTLFTVSDRLRKADPILVTLLVNMTELEMEVDTGAALSVISEMTYRNLWPASQAPPIRRSPAPAPLHPWEWPSRPWARLHIDHAGPFQGKLFFGGGRCFFQMDGCFNCSLYFIKCYHNCTAFTICNSWVTGDHCVRQWSCI